MKSRNNIPPHDTTQRDVSDEAAEIPAEAKDKKHIPKIAAFCVDLPRWRVENPGVLTEQTMGEKVHIYWHMEALKLLGSLLGSANKYDGDIHRSVGKAYFSR